MGFDFEEILGDMDYEDAVDMAVEALDKLQESELTDEVSDAESEEVCDEATESENDEETKEAGSGDADTQRTYPVGGAHFMDGMSDTPVFE